MKTILLLGNNRAIVQTADGRILFPQSHFLNSCGTGDAPKVATQVKFHNDLKGFELFLTLEELSIEENILNNQAYLDVHQAVRLKHWLGLTLEYMQTCKQVPLSLFNDFARSKAQKKIKLASEKGIPNPDPRYVALSTYSQRIAVLRSYLNHHYRFFGREMVNFDRSHSLRKSLDETLTILGDFIQLGRAHESQINSFPQNRWHSIIEVIMRRPETVFLTESDASCSDIRKHQLITLLAAEGLRRGAVANLRVQDHRDDGLLHLRPNGHHWDKVNNGQRKRGTASLKIRNSTDLSNVGFHFAVNDLTNHFFKLYLHERTKTIKKYGADRTEGFLFVKPDSGKPFTHHAHVDYTFKALERGLDKLGLLKIDANDIFGGDLNKYECRPHVFRHSGVCERALIWLEQSSRTAKLLKKALETGADPEIIDGLRSLEITQDISSLEEYLRKTFSWAAGSDMPSLYAKRVEKLFVNDLRSAIWGTVLDRKEEILGDTSA